MGMVRSIRLTTYVLRDTVSHRFPRERGECYQPATTFLPIRFARDEGWRHQG
jgi:hypothetical protein